MQGDLSSLAPLFFILLLVACGEGNTTGYGGSRSAARADAAVEERRDAGPSDARAAAPPAADGASGTGDDLDSCTEVDLEATLRNVPVDIVWVVDSSGSIFNERATIQQSLNDFAAKFADAAIDVRVVVMTDADDFEVPPPLGDDRARFLLVDGNVDSDDALTFFVERFDEYASFLRADAKLELVAVTDDESNLTASEFVSEMHTQAEKDFRLHAIASERIGGDACEGASAPGDEYYAAAALTSGLTFSICDADNSALFDELGNALSEGTPIPCELNLPAPPPGLSLDLNLINVVYEAAPGQSGQVVPRVGERARCGERGWFYDRQENPSVLSLCPRACAAMSTGKLRITFGCRTIVI